MLVVPVLDLKGGVVVRGIGGRRDEYQPIQSQIAANAQPATVARAFVEHFGLPTAYVADLDAIQGASPDLAAYHQIAASGMNLWLDAGLNDVVKFEALRCKLLAAGIAARLIMGLESLSDHDCLKDIAASARAQNLLFSLDLKAGVPLTRIPEWQSLSPGAIVEQIVAVGVERIILLDLADVGSQGGTSTLALCRELRAAHPHLKLTLGGGVRGPADLQALAAAGASAALVASALHDGRLTRGDCLLVG